MLGWIRLYVDESSKSIIDGVNIQLNKAGDIFIESFPGYKGSEYDSHEQFILEKNRGCYREEYE